MFSSRRYSPIVLILPLLLSALLLISLEACSSQGTSANQTNTTEETTAAEETATERESDLPQRLLYDEEYYTVESIDFYQDYSDYEYNLYAVVKIDLSEMSEAGQHWLLERNLSGPVLNTEVAVADEFSYGVDGDELHSADRYIDGNTVYYFFYSDKARDSYEGLEFKLYVTNHDYERQLDTDDPRYNEASLFDYGTVPSGLSAPEAMPGDVYEAFADNLSDIADAIASY